MALGEFAVTLGISLGTLYLLIIIILWDAVWKLAAMWKSARNNQKVWFIILAIINSVGILPIIYILWFQKKDKVRRKK